MGNLAESRAELEAATDATRIEAVWYKIWQERPDLANEANKNLITEDISSAFSTVTLATVRESIAHLEGEGRLGVKDRKELARQEAERIHALGRQNGRIADFSARTKDAIERQEAAEPPVVLKTSTGEVIETAQQVKALSAPDLQKLMSRPRSLARLNEILAGKRL
jgi:hypothetical protein